MNRLRDVDFIVKMTGLPRWRVYDLVARNLFPAIRVGRRLYFDPDQVEQWIAAGGKALPGGWREDPGR